MKFLVCYATTEGHTRRIARRAAGWICDAGHCVELLPVADAGDIDLGGFDGVIVAASIHVGQYQKDLTAFASDRRDDLASARTLFLSVSLSASGHDAEDWRGLDRIAVDFEEATGWIPGRLEQVAGAYAPSRYDVFRRLIMRRIIAKKDPEADLAADRDYTDWAALRTLIAGWIAG